MADVLVETSVLTSDQADIAHALCAMLEGFDYADAFAAMVAVLAGCINGAAGSGEDATLVATAIGDQLVDLVEQGQSDLPASNMRKARAQRLSGPQPNQQQRRPTMTITITRPETGLPILAVTGRDTISIRAGSVIRLGEKSFTFPEETAIALGAIKPGTNYALALDEVGVPVLAPAGSPIEAGAFAGFHFAPGGNAEGRAGGDAVPAINPFSLWDIGFRPSCPDPRGMTLVETKDGKSVWVDIYLLGVDHDKYGTSRYGVEIADGRSLELLDYPTAVKILAGHGKRLLTYDEFCAAAYGVTERSSAARDPISTGRDVARTSRFGLMQATGNLWVWGTDGDPDDPRPSVFGGSWFYGSNAGSRYASLGRWPGYSYDSLSVRGACDHMAPV